MKGREEWELTSAFQPEQPREELRQPLGWGSLLGNTEDLVGLICWLDSLVVTSATV